LVDELGEIFADAEGVAGVIHGARYFNLASHVEGKRRIISPGVFTLR
jgi:hypothetical protein